MAIEMTPSVRRIGLVLACAPLFFLLWVMFGPATAEAGQRPQPLTTTTSPPPCGNDRDDDSDGKTDHPEDPGCTEYYDSSEDLAEVQTTSSIDFMPRTGAFRGRLSVSLTEPKRVAEQCLGRRVALFESRPGSDRFVDATRTRSNGIWLIETAKELNGPYYLLIYPKRPAVRWFDKVKCETGRSEKLPVYTDAPVLHPYCNGKAATVVGTPGDDQMRVREERDLGDVIVTFDGHDNVAAGSGPDVVCGGAGDDVIDGDAGIDQLFGGPGKDHLLGGAGGALLSFYEDEYLASNADGLWPGPGEDIVDGGEGTDYVSLSDSTQPIFVDLASGTATGDGTDQLLGVEAALGSVFDDTMIGSEAPEGLFGGPGSDSLSGMGGLDYVWGEDGNDSITLGPGDDYGFGDLGQDILFGDEGDDKVYGDVYFDAGEADEMHGGDGDDQLFGMHGNDRMWGDDGNDRLEGWDGDDSLDGGVDVDYLNGAEGTDSCVNGEETVQCESSSPSPSP